MDVIAFPAGSFVPLQILILFESAKRWDGLHCELILELEINRPPQYTLPRAISRKRQEDAEVQTDSAGRQRHSSACFSGFRWTAVDTDSTSAPMSERPCGWPWRRGEERYSVDSPSNPELTVICWARPYQKKKMDGSFPKALTNLARIPLTVGEGGLTCDPPKTPQRLGAIF